MHGIPALDLPTKNRKKLLLSLLVLMGLSYALLHFGSRLNDTIHADKSLRHPLGIRETSLHRGPGSRAEILDAYANLPLSFEANLGQTGLRVKFLTRVGGYTAFLTSTEAVLAVHDRNTLHRTTQPSRTPDLLRLGLMGANPDSEVIGMDELPGKSNYFFGSDPQKWRTNVPNYAKVKCVGVYPGIDLIYYGSQRQLEYDFLVAPAADPTTIRLGVVGEDRAEANSSPLRVDSSGQLVVRTGNGEVRFHKPVVYQNSADRGQRRLIDGRYRLYGNQAGFEIAAYDATKPLIIDPVLSYSSFLGGNDDDARDSVSVAVDSAGNAYIASGTLSTNFPVTPGSFQTNFGGAPSICDQGNFFCGDAFVTKINSTGTAIIYSTYLGGSDSDYAFGLAVDASGNAYVTGLTKSSNFPVTPGAFQPAFGGAPPVCDVYVCGDTFVTKLNSTGSALLYSSYLGGSDNDYAEAVAIDAQGNAYVTGSTASANFPTTPGAFQTQFTGNYTCTGRSGATRPCQDSYVTKVNPAGTQLVYSTYLGGFSGDDNAGGIAVDAAGHAVVSGATCGTDFPVTPGGFQTQSAGPCDVFFTTLNAAGSKLLYSSYLGGDNYEGSFSVAVDSSGNAYLTGLTFSSNFPVTPGAVQTTPGGSGDAFVAKFNPRLSGAASLVYSTYLGGDNFDIGAAVAVDSQGNAYASGDTYSSNFPTVSPVQATRNGIGDAFIVEINPAGNAFVYSTFLGGSSLELLDSIAIDQAGNAYLAGWTRSADFPTTPKTFQPTFGDGNRDVFVAKITPGNTPGVSFVPASLAFGTQAVGTTSPPQTIILHNVGSASLSISSVRTTGDFSQTNNCGASLAGGGSCAVSIAFAPTGAGTRVGTLGVSDNAGGSPQKLKLTGTGK
jgi:hypothetical protein